MNVRVHYEVFIARWKRLATCFVDNLSKGDNNNGIAYDSTFVVFREINWSYEKLNL